MLHNPHLRAGFPLRFPRLCDKIILFAGMVELADTLDLGSNGIAVQVQVLLPAPDKNNPNQIFLIGDGFGLFVFFERFEDTHFRNGVVKRPTSKP